MSKHRTSPASFVRAAAAAFSRGRTTRARACLALGVLTASAGLVAAGAGPAAAAPAVLYAASAAAGTGDCSTAANACTLATALGDVAPDGAIELVTPGADAPASHYVGNWTISTAGTSASATVTIEAAPGLASPPILDGNETAGVLTVPAGEYVALSGLTITGGKAGVLNGGGLNNSGTATVTDCTFTGDSAALGGAIDNGDGLFGGTGSLTVTDSTFTDNHGYFDGAAISGGNNGGGGTITVTGSTFTDNTAFYSGGAIENGIDGGGALTVADSTFTDNNATFGGAIDNGQNDGTGTVTVTGSTFTGNAVVGDGGAIDNGQNGSAGVQGGGTVTVSQSTFTGNTAAPSGDGLYGFGGAIASGDLVQGGGGSVTVTASTFSGNLADNSGTNSSDIEGGGAGSVQVAGDVFADGCTVAGPWTDGGYNAGDGSCLHSGTGDVSSGALNLGPLAGNGGPTQTFLPGPGSKAIGIIPSPTSITMAGSKVTLCPTVDQRGYASTGSTCDAGSVQTVAFAPAVTTTTLTSSENPSLTGQAVTFTATVSPVPDGGTVTFTDDDGFGGRVEIAGCGAVPVSSSGAATCRLTYISPGSDSVAAAYSGDATFVASTSDPLSQVINNPVSNTATTLTSSANPSVVGQKVTYTATVSPTDGGGSVSFLDGGTAVTGCAARPLSSTGQATCQVTYATTGSHAIAAAYSGDSGYAGSASASLTEQVVANKADLAVKISVPARAADGSSITETITVTNNGPASATKVATSLAEPAGLVVTNRAGASGKGQVLTWTTASLAPQASVTFTVTAQVGSHARGVVVLAAGTLSPTPDPHPLNNISLATVRLG